MLISRIRYAIFLCLIFLYGGIDGIACGGKEHLSLDAGISPPDTSGLLADKSTSSERILIPTINFIVQGCDNYVMDKCSGVAPLTLTFIAVTEGDSSNIVWDLGDSSVISPGHLMITHTYEKPGRFTVTLAREDRTGIINEQKIDFVDVEPAQPGAACSKDINCASGKCICHGTCTFPLNNGFCLEECSNTGCIEPAAACVNLAAKSDASSEPWQKQVCLMSCTTDQDCQRSGFKCQLAPTKNKWQKVCLPPLLRFIGAPCRSATGVPDASFCLGDLCLDIGASGYCSNSCLTNDCPEGTRCATLKEPFNTSACLLRCDTNDETQCTTDPFLTCELPDISGQYGFEITNSADPSGSRYCAPKRCAYNDDCGPNGRCDLEIGGFCVTQSNSL